MYPIKLNESDLRYIVKNIIREYHKGQQLMLPFDGNDEPYNYMQFIEWLEENGQYGKLPAKPGVLEKTFENPDVLFNMGVSVFYFGLGEELDDEGYYDFMSDFVNRNGEGVLSGDYNVDTILDGIGTVEDTPYYLTEQGTELWKNTLIEKGREIAKWWANRCLVNEQGLIYCERMIGIEPVMGRHHDPDEYGNKDFYQVLDDNYTGIGECWSYAKGGGQVYFNNGGQQDALIKGWVSPEDVDWGACVALETMDEQELRLNYDATVQIDSIEVWFCDEAGNYGKHNLPLKGSLLISVQAAT